MENKPCPWCSKRTGPDGVTSSFVYAAHQVEYRGPGAAPCGYCKGTGRYSEWAKHPEKRRQLADDRLTKFKLVFP